ncbi:hypothetical protein L484_007181 [Morus notabilis]|uniref:RNase H type-1 domain-containing protein n=1 Tax=Morus notabilis TaxID=981085 RepID=W9QSD9_9ROSA|nr:hypothetical protein L484_007181 [Morus notabilis]
MKQRIQIGRLRTDTGGVAMAAVVRDDTGRAKAVRTKTIELCSVLEAAKLGLLLALDLHYLEVELEGDCKRVIEGLINASSIPEWSLIPNFEQLILFSHSIRRFKFIRDFI